ncbi:restriction endonuclease [Paraburkholderia caribensis]|uniref:restriction endonuclease n=1 Tax=Paraburkholderia caribensis TaxID=75105 RepID=UPI0034D2C4C7
MTEDKKIEMPVDGERLIQDVLADLGWDAPAADVARGVRRLDIGLPLEDEFSVVCAWLGKCELLHKLDQQQVPVGSREKFQVPDLLARFSTQTNSVPVLIEIKSKKANTLSFQPDYLERLLNYAALVRMPLLIGWKFHSLWMPFEVKHLQRAVKNFNISLSTAATQNLIGALAGDVAYKIGAGAGIHLRFRKDQLLSGEPTHDGWNEQWKMTFDEVAFTDRDGTRIDDLDTDIQALFTAWDLESHEQHTPTHVYQRLVAGHDNGMQFGHSTLVRMLDWQSPDNARPHWRPLLRKEQAVANVESFSAALQKALRQKIVSHVFHFQPVEMPDFLSLANAG